MDEVSGNLKITPSLSSPTFDLALFVRLSKSDGLSSTSEAHEPSSGITTVRASVQVRGTSCLQPLKHMIHRQASPVYVRVLLSPVAGNTRHLYTGVMGTKKVDYRFGETDRTSLSSYVPHLAGGRQAWRVVRRNRTTDPFTNLNLFFFLNSAVDDCPRTVPLAYSERYDGR